MKKSKLENIAWAIFALALSSTIAVAQGPGARNNYYQQQNAGCLYNISNISEEQQQQIAELQEQHQRQMAELRTKRRSTVDVVKKSEIRTEMLKKTETYRNEVRRLLTAGQQAEFDKLFAWGTPGNIANMGCRNRGGNKVWARPGNQAAGTRAGTCAGAGPGQNQRNFSKRGANRNRL